MQRLLESAQTAGARRGACQMMRLCSLRCTELSRTCRARGRRETCGCVLPAPPHKLEQDTRTAQADADSLRQIRLTVKEDGQPKVEAFPLTPMPSCNSAPFSTAGSAQSPSPPD